MALFGILLYLQYLCSRVHAVLALERAVKVWVKTFWNSVLQRFVFGFFEPRKFKTCYQEQCRVDATVRYYISR
jgi:hypothetical protein